MGNVDFILNNWFGEPPEYSDNERTLIRHLYEPLREIERQRNQLSAQLKLAQARIDVLNKAMTKE